VKSLPNDGTGRPIFVPRSGSALPVNVAATLELFGRRYGRCRSGYPPYLYRKGSEVSELFSRSLDGDVADNPEEKFVRGCVMVFGIVPTKRGVYYVGCNEQNEPVAPRYFEFSSRMVFDLGTHPLSKQPILTVSAEGRRLVYHTKLPSNGKLTRVSFRPAER